MRRRRIVVLTVAIWLVILAAAAFAAPHAGILNTMSHSV
jgi:hypothetical protein